MVDVGQGGKVTVFLLINLFSVPPNPSLGLSLLPTPCSSTPCGTAPWLSILSDEGLDGSGGLHTSM